MSEQNSLNRAVAALTRKVNELLKIFIPQGTPYQVFHHVEKDDGISYLFRFCGYPVYITERPFKQISKHGRNEYPMFDIMMWDERNHQSCASFPYFEDQYVADAAWHIVSKLNNSRIEHYKNLLILAHTRFELTKTFLAQQLEYPPTLYIEDTPLTKSVKIRSKDRELMMSVDDTGDISIIRTKANLTNNIPSSTGWCCADAIYTIVRTWFSD